MNGIIEHTRDIVDCDIADDNIVRPFSFCLDLNANVRGLDRDRGCNGRGGTATYTLKVRSVVCGTR